MEKQKYCRYCGKRIPKKGNRVYYCSEWCSRQWHYENQDYLFYTPGVKQEKCVVCGKDLLPRQLKYCSKACYAKGKYGRSELIMDEMVKVVKRVID